jgi:hypothetical protein
MTGYLQRIASSAISPGGSVRPVAGTVFSPSRYRAALGPSVAEQDIMSARPDDMDARRGSVRPAAREPAPVPGALRGPQEAKPGNRPAPEAPLEIYPLKAAVARGEGRPPAEAQPGTDRDPAARPEVARSPEPGLRVRRADDGAEAGSAERRAARPRDEEPPAGSPDAGRQAGEADTPRSGTGPRDAFKERPFAPVVAVDFRTQATSDGGPAGPAGSSRLAAGREHNREGRVRAAPSEADEINIHIGRIEVTAAQQPLRPAAPKAHRKAPSLEEYLRRRSGRIP